MSVEGPPGTGKSQTIVNTIAAAISAGKKVLFVAEKMAALEVVRSRLEACGVGEFLLTLQANRSSKSKVIQSIRDRISLPYEIEPSGLEERIDRLRRTRSKLKEYINIMSSVFSETNFTVHDILGWGISARDKLSKHSQNLLECKVSNLKTITKEILNEIIDVSNQFETAFKRNLTFKQHWSFIKRANIDPYSADEILKLAQNVSKSCNDSNLLRGKLTSMKLSKDVDRDELIKFKDCLNEIEGYSGNIDIELVEKLSNWAELYNGALKKIDIFFKDKEDTLLIYERFQSIYSNPLDEGLSKTLANLAKIVNEMGLQNLKTNTAEEISEKINSELLGMQKEMEVVSEARKVKGFLLNKTIQAVVTACDIGSNSQRSVLAMRKETLEPALVKVVIMKSSETCNSLRQKKEELEKDYYIETFDKDEIDCNCEIFIKSGLFAIFSSKYRIAKRSYLSISKDKKFRKAKAINQSKVISRWLEELKSFNETGGLLEDSFDGLETNYKLLEELMNYYDQIDTKLSGVENKEIREFLKRGDIDLILALPEIDPDHTIRKSNYSTYEALSAVANQIKVKKEKFKGYIKDLEDLVSVFVDYKYVDVNLLSEARNELGAFQEKWRSLNDNAELKKLLGNYFKGIETDRKEIQTSIDMASKIVYLGSELGNAMTLIFKDESISESIVKLESIINTDLKFEEEISKLAKLVNVKSEEIILSRSKQELSAFLNEAANNKEGLMAFSIVHANRLAFHSRGLGSIIDNLLLPEGKIDGLANIVVAVIGQLLAREVYKEYGNVLVSYDGSKLNHLRQTFAKLDKDIIGLSRKKLRVTTKEK